MIKKTIISKREFEHYLKLLLNEFHFHSLKNAQGQYVIYGEENENIWGIFKKYIHGYMESFFLNVDELFNIATIDIPPSTFDEDVISDFYNLFEKVYVHRNKK